MFLAEFKIVEAEWMKNPKLRWNVGLNRAGFNFRAGLQRNHYPPIPPNSTYDRTYLTADKANWRIVRQGEEMVFGSTHYLPYLLFDGKRKALWPAKKAELLLLMKQGFISGIRDYRQLVVK